MTKDEREIAEIEYECLDCGHTWVRNYTHDDHCLECNSTNIKKDVYLE